MLPVLNSRIVPRFFDDDWNSLFEWSNQGFQQNSMTIPSTNVKETSNEFVVELAAPGMDKEDFQIMIENNVLKIRSERNNESQEENENYTRREFSYQSFERSFTLNSKLVEDAKIMATYDAGILQVLIPKKEEAKVKPARQIEVK